MRVAVFSAKPYDHRFFIAGSRADLHTFEFLPYRLTAETAALARGFPAVCVFVQDAVDHVALATLAAGGTKFVALRCAGFNNVDLSAAAELGIKVVRVPAYSPHAVAEHAVALMMALNRKIHRAYHRVREGNFALEGLLGFDMHGRTVGIVGTGQIGAGVARIMHGFGCHLLAYDVQPNSICEALGTKYCSLEELYAESQVISLHCPLTPQTFHLINARAIEQMRDDVMLINASRGAVIETRAVIDGLKSGKIGYLGLDVYEEEADLFFEDLSNRLLQDDMLARLLTFPNVIITGHQAFFTRDALEQIAATTIANLTQLERGEDCPHEVKADRVTK